MVVSAKPGTSTSTCRRTGARSAGAAPQGVNATHPRQWCVSLKPATLSTGLSNKPRVEQLCSCCAEWCWRWRGGGAGAGVPGRPAGLPAQQDLRAAAGHLRPGAGPLVARLLATGRLGAHQPGIRRLPVPRRLHPRPPGHGGDAGGGGRTPGCRPPPGIDRDIPKD